MVKVILLHGDRTRGSTHLAEVSSAKDEEIFESGSAAPWMLKSANKQSGTDNYVQALKDSKKPVVAVFRGEAANCGFTILDVVDFVYLGPDAYFNTPFMMASSVGNSSSRLPQVSGQRLAAASLLQSKPLNAQQAVKYGFANSIIDEL